MKKIMILLTLTPIIALGEPAYAASQQKKQQGYWILEDHISGKTAQKVRYYTNDHMLVSVDTVASGHYNLRDWRCRKQLTQRLREELCENARTKTSTQAQPLIRTMPR